MTNTLKERDGEETGERDARLNTNMGKDAERGRRRGTGEEQAAAGTSEGQEMAREGQRKAKIETDPDMEAKKNRP